MRVLVVFGGRSGEHEVSVLSARSVTNALETSGHEVLGVGITRHGRWVRCDPRSVERVPEDAEPFELAVNTAARSMDVAFPAMHGPHGEDGAVQGLFEMVGLPYVGAGIEGSAIGTNKDLQKILFRVAGLPVVRFLALDRRVWEEDPDRWSRILVDEVGFPCFAKPARLGSSVGISRILDADGIESALKRAFRHDDLALVEAAGGPRELEIGALEIEDRLELSCVGEVVPAADFYDYTAKYRSTDTVLKVPAEVPESVADEIGTLARRAFGTARCEGLARIDFFWDPEADRLLLNEINTIPGLTPMSMFPRLWEATGRPFPEVVEHLVAHARRRHERRAQLETARLAAHADEVGGSPS